MIPKEIFEQSILDFFAPIRPFLEDDSVNEVMINGHDTIYVERRGTIDRTTARFSSQEELLAALRNLAQFVGRHLGPDRPILEARFPDGSRVEAIVPPASPDGPMVAIRRFARERLTADALLRGGSLTAEALATLEGLIAGKQNVVVAGGTASGKTSLLNVLSGYIPGHERTVVIEDARELQLRQPHVVQLEAQPPDARGKGQVTIRELFRATLRMRPDRIVVGEVRGGEALDLIQAMTSGHGGCLTTVHATHPLDTVNRLETLALMSDVALPLPALRAQLASAIDIIVHTDRLADGSRCVTHITELGGLDDRGGYRLVDLFVRRFHGRDDDGAQRSTLEPTGAQPSAAAYLRGKGIELPTLGAPRRPAEPDGYTEVDDLPDPATDPGRRR
jgi:pilus assembly protein CpaF